MQCPEEFSPWFPLLPSSAGTRAHGAICDEATDMVRRGVGMEEVCCGDAVC